MAEPIIVYTAITNGYDLLRNDILCFTEEDFTAHRFLPEPNLNSLIFKILPHKFFYSDVSIYVDGNIYLQVEPEILVKEFLGKADIATWKHPYRKCVYQEGPYNFVRVIGDKEKEKKIILEQLEHYKKIGISENFGLAEPNVIIRRHNKKVARFNEAWWAEICRWSYRDQISFTIIAREFPDLKINLIDGNVRHHPYFKYISHLKNA